MAKQGDPAFAQICAAADALRDELVTFRRDLHKHPELGWTEMRTSSLIARKLKEIGVDEILVGDQVCDREARMGVPSDEVLEEHYKLAEATGGDPEFLPYTKGGMTGVIGIIRCGEGPVIGMRFDIDALPILENNTQEHFPVVHGFRSEFDGVMHACGHDGHTTTGIGVAKVLCGMRDKLHGTIKLVFQPSEEGVRGAKSIVEKGHLDDVQYMLGAHIGGGAGITEAIIGTGTGRSMATTKMDVTFHVKAAHAGAAPQDGDNAMLAAACAIMNLQAIPRHGASATRINVGKMVAGSGRNVICDKAVLEMEVRGVTSEGNDYVANYARRIIDGAAKMHGCTYEITLQGEAKSNCNSEDFTKYVGEVCGQKLGLKTVEVPDNPNGGGSEDYSFMSDRVMSHGGKSCYFMNLVPLEGPIHNQHYDFNEDALTNGVKAFAGVAYDLMNE